MAIVLKDGGFFVSFAFYFCIISIVFAGLLYYVFHDVLGVLLPAGLLEGVLA